MFAKGGGLPFKRFIIWPCSCDLNQSDPGSKILLPRFVRMVREVIFMFSLGIAITPAVAGRGNLQLVPDGWYVVQDSDEHEGTRRYVSPDGRSILTFGDADAGLHDAAAEKDQIAR